MKPNEFIRQTKPFLVDNYWDELKDLGIAPVEFMSWLEDIEKYIVKLVPHIYDIQELKFHAALLRHLQNSELGGDLLSFMISKPDPEAMMDDCIEYVLSIHDHQIVNRKTMKKQFAPLKSSPSVSNINLIHQLLDTRNKMYRNVGAYLTP